MTIYENVNVFIVMQWHATKNPEELKQRSTIFSSLTVYAEAVLSFSVADDVLKYDV